MKSQCYSLQPETSQGVAGVPFGISGHGWGQGGMGEAGLFIHGFVLLLVMATATPQLSHLCIPTLVTGISHSMHLLLGEEGFCLSPFPRAAENVLYNQILIATGSSGILS